MALQCWEWIADLTWQDITLTSVQVEHIHLIGKVLVILRLSFLMLVDAFEDWGALLVVISHGDVFLHCVSED